MEIVYLLSTHDEYGAENMQATTKPENLESMLKKYYLHYSNSPECQEALEGLREALDNQNTEMDSKYPTNLTSSWGGPQLHIVTLNRQ